MNFAPYEAKPVIRMAFQITEDHLMCKVEGEEATYAVGAHVGKPFIKFKAYEEPKVGDWVVRLTETDTYHCTDAVFRERNIVSDTLNEFGKAE